MYSYDSMKLLYDPDNSKSYGDFDPSQPGYDVYAEAITQGCIGHRPGARVLDIGCGTGRWFHCLRDVKLLVGLDASLNMLNIAHRRLPELDALSHTECLLFEADIRKLMFMPDSFDFIYSTGVLGEYVPFDQVLLESILSWLSVRGSCFITIVDKDAFRNYEDRLLDSRKPSLKYSIRKLITPLAKVAVNINMVNFFPCTIAKQMHILYDFSQFYMTKKELTDVLNKVSMPFTYELISFQDRKHVHFGLKLFKSGK